MVYPPDLGFWGHLVCSSSTFPVCSGGLHWWLVNSLGFIGTLGSQLRICVHEPSLEMLCPALLLISNNCRPKLYNSSSTMTFCLFSSLQGSTTDVVAGQPGRAEQSKGPCVPASQTPIVHPPPGMCYED